MRQTHVSYLAAAGTWRAMRTVEAPGMQAADRSLCAAGRLTLLPPTCSAALNLSLVPATARPTGEVREYATSKSHSLRKKSKTGDRTCC